MSDIKTATMRGALSANERKTWMGRVKVTAHSITDNPYDRKAHKKEHVAWHNAFYETRKHSKFNRLIG